jgi:hypothetical protein
VKTALFGFVNMFGNSEVTAKAENEISWGLGNHLAQKSSFSHQLRGWTGIAQE